MIYKLSTLEFYKNELLAKTKDLGTWTTFSKRPGSAFSQGQGLGPSPLYKVSPCNVLFRLLMGVPSVSSMSSLLSPSPFSFKSSSLSPSSSSPRQENQSISGMHFHMYNRASETGLFLKRPYSKPIFRYHTTFLS